MTKFLLIVALLCAAGAEATGLHYAFVYGSTADAHAAIVFALIIDGLIVLCAAALAEETSR